MSIAKIARGTALIGLVNVLRLFVQLFSVPVLARFLSPVDYGLAAMAMPIILFVMMFADAGLGISLVRTGENQRSGLAYCFWLSAGLGIVLAVGIAVLSPLLGFLLDEPRLTSFL